MLDGVKGDVACKGCVKSTISIKQQKQGVCRSFLIGSLTKVSDDCISILVLCASLLMWRMSLRVFVDALQSIGTVPFEEVMHK